LSASPGPVFDPGTPARIQSLRAGSEGLREVRIVEPLRRLVLGPDYPDPASTHLAPDNYTAPVGFDGLAARFARREPAPCHICGSIIPYQHRFLWCSKQLEKEVARRRK